jgi:hypothetical protein
LFAVWSLLIPCILYRNLFSGVTGSAGDLSGFFGIIRNSLAHGERDNVLFLYVLSNLTSDILYFSRAARFLKEVNA